jgi:hypothetical protein
MMTDIPLGFAGVNFVSVGIMTLEIRTVPFTKTICSLIDDCLDPGTVPAYNGISETV